MRTSFGTPPGFEEYSNNLFQVPPELSQLLRASRSFSDELNKTPISVSQVEGSILATLVASHSCKKFIEVGTLTGYSALWILWGLQPGGELYTFEKDHQHAQKALEIFARVHDYSDREIEAFAKKRAHLFEGDAEELLPTVANEGPFDGIFIDGNKLAYGRYLDWAEQNLKKGGLVIGDNVFCGGAVWGGDPSGRFNEKQAAVMKDFNRRLADPKHYISTIIPTAEGMFFAIKR